MRAAGACGTLNTVGAITRRLNERSDSMKQMIIEMEQLDGERRCVTLEARPHGVLVVGVGRDEVRIQVAYDDRVLGVDTNLGMCVPLVVNALDFVTLTVPDEVAK